MPLGNSETDVRYLVVELAPRRGIALPVTESDVPGRYRVAVDRALAPGEQAVCALGLVRREVSIHQSGCYRCSVSDADSGEPLNVARDADIRSLLVNRGRFLGRAEAA